MGDREKSGRGEHSREVYTQAQRGEMPGREYGEPQSSTMRKGGLGEEAEEAVGASNDGPRHLRCVSQKH